MASTSDTTTTTTGRQSKRIFAGTSRLWRSGALATIFAAIAGIIICTAAIAVGAVPADYALLRPVRIIVISALAALAATILLAALARWVRRPILTFRSIAAVFLIVSFAGPLGVSASAATVATMLLMHVMAAAIIVAVLTPPARATR